MGSLYNFVPPTAEQVAFVRKQLNTTEKEVKQAVKTLRAWLEMQPHLPDKIGDDHIERLYINSKCSMERTKLGLDAYFSLKHRLPEFMMNRDPLAPEILLAKENVKLIVMPRMTKEGYRIFINTDVNPDPAKYDFVTHIKMMAMEVEILMQEDYSLGDIFIINLQNTGMGHLLKIDINSVRSTELIYRTATCRRLKGLHFVNAPKIIDHILKIARTVLSEKLQKRVYAHLPGSTTLLDHVPSECIPNELGGTAGPVDKFSYELFNKSIDRRVWFLEQDKYVSDESKRPKDNRFAEDIYGIAGSFKKLNVD